MKKTFVLSLVMLFVTIFSAQSLKLMDETGNDINGTVHYRYENLADLTQTIFQIENLTSNNLTLKVKAEKIYVPHISSGLEVVVNSGGNVASGNMGGQQTINYSYSISGNALISWFKIAPVTWLWTTVTGNDSAVWNVTIYDE